MYYIILHYISNVFDVLVWDPWERMDFILEPILAKAMNLDMITIIMSIVIISSSSSSSN